MGEASEATVVFGVRRLARLRAFCDAKELGFSSTVQIAVDALMDADGAITLLRHGNHHAAAMPSPGESPAAPPLTLSPPDLLFPLPDPTQISPLQDGGKGNGTREELRWRVDQCWLAFCETRKRFFHQENQQDPPPLADNPRPEVARAIVTALREFDADRMGAADRERWKRESPVRAAGQGIFLSDWHTGRAKDNDLNNGGKRYLEDWRPWKTQARKGSPVPGFAALAFEARSRRRA